MSVLGKYVNLMRDPDPAKAIAEARKAYAESQGDIVLINRQWLNGWAAKKQLELLAEQAGVAPRRK